MELVLKIEMKETEIIRFFARACTHTASDGLFAGDTWTYNLPNGVTAVLRRNIVSMGHEDGLYELSVKYPKSRTTYSYGFLDELAVYRHLRQAESLSKKMKLSRKIA